jgi:S-sulfo-L-cysteine synthase (O-acetyl-L-serine-dependent)
MKLHELIGNTALVELVNTSPSPRVKIFGKLEGDNPGGSVKDRTAYGMISGALQRGDIKKGDRLVEATSGNTGIALAMIARIMGLDMTLIMPDNSTRERVLAMEAYGARVILTPAAQTIEYSRSLAEGMAANEGYYMLNQFANPDNYKIHYQTTGPEIWHDTAGTITHFVSAMGTTGTIMGVSRYLKEQNANVQIVGTQPTDGSCIPGIRRWSPEFLPKIFERERVDRILDVSEHDAREFTKGLAKEEGILAGMSSGGALSAAVRIAGEIDKGVIVFIICDRGDRYLSSDLFTPAR